MNHCSGISPSLPHSVVKKEATPADYNNEELYMEMEKIYFAVNSYVYVQRTLSNLDP